MAAQGPARGGARPRLPGPQELGKADPLRRLRSGGQRGLGERGHRPRHGRASPWPPSAAGGGELGRARYPQAARLLITADSGGQQRLPRAALEMGTAAPGRSRRGWPSRVCHFPPGTSKWNKIEHRLFSFISQNWRGQPLLTHAVIVSLIASTTHRHRPEGQVRPRHRHLSGESASPTRRWPRSISTPTPSTASGTTPSNPTQSDCLLIDKPYVESNLPGSHSSSTSVTWYHGGVTYTFFNSRLIAGTDAIHIAESLVRLPTITAMPTSA